MRYSHLAAVVCGACFSFFAADLALAHGDTGGGGGMILPPGTTLVSFDYEVTSFNEISDARLTALALAGVEEVHSLKTISVPSLTIGYGLTRDLTLAVRMPYLHNDDIRETDPDTGGVNPRGGVSGFGDVSFTGTYRFFNDAVSGVSAAVIAGFKAPTGPTDRVDASGETFETEHQPGSGSWDAMVGGKLYSVTGRLMLSVTGLYVFSGRGAADTTVGDRFNYGVTASYQVWSSKAGSGHLGASYVGSHVHDKAGHGDADASLSHTHDYGQYTDAMAIDVTLGLNGEWADKIEAGDEVNENTGGHVLYVTPGVKLSAGGWAAYVNGGIPVARDLNGIQSDPDWRLATGVSFQF